MDFSIRTLLSNFTDDKLVAPKALEKKLGCEEEVSQRQLQIALDALEKIGILTKERGKYRRVFEEGVVEGKLRCSSKGFGFAIQDAEDADDIYVREQYLSNAWNGDRVLVKVMREGGRKRSPEGEVRLILERSNSSILAKVKQTETGEYRAVPLDDRLLFEVDLVPQAEPDLAAAVDHLVNVAVLRYPLGQHPPLGKVVQILGTDAEAAADIDIVCCKHSLPRAFPDAVLKALSSINLALTEADLKQREDLREMLTIAFVAGDPATEPIECAFSLEKTQADHWRLGVHIADVTRLVPPESALDREAQRRGRAIHLGKLRVPMLPEAIIEAASLQPGEDRLAISLLATLDGEGQLLEFELQPTVVRVDYCVTGEQVAAIVAPQAEGKTQSGLPAAIEDLVKQCFELSQILREERRQRGVFELSLPCQVLPGKTPDAPPIVLTRLPYDDVGTAGGVVTAASPLRAIVAELTILTNQLAALHFRALAVPAFYRVQPPPDLEDVQELMRLAEGLGVTLSLEAANQVKPEDYQRFSQQFATAASQRVLTYLLLDTLKPVVYSFEPGAHFGLALSTGYVQMTAPLERYADLMQLRILQALFTEGRDRRSTRSKERVNLRHSSSHGKVNWNVLPPDAQQELASQMQTLVGPLNERERLAQEAEADLAGLKKAEFMKAHTGSVFAGLVTGVQSYGFFVEIEDTLVEGLVHVSSLKDDWYEFDPKQQRLVGRKSRRQYRLGDRVEVQIKSVDYYRQQIDLGAVGGGSESTEAITSESEASSAEGETSLADRSHFGGRRRHDYPEED
ncbi:ribonuclease R family protein [Trichothermofontia sp.]